VFFECRRKWVQREDIAQIYDDRGADFPFASTFYPGTLLRAEAQQVTVKAGRTTTGVDIAVGHLGRIRGHVKDPSTGGPLAHRCVQYDGGLRQQTETTYVPDGIGATPTDANGDYSFLGPPGQYLVGATRVAATGFPATTDTDGCNSTLFWWLGTPDKTAVTRIWRAFGLQPHRHDTWKLSKDPQFVAKVRDVVGLYLDPPERAVVLCVDEKSQIQALDRTAPILPMLPGTPQRATHDYKRHGTSSLYAALDITTGKVIGSLHANTALSSSRSFCIPSIAKSPPISMCISSSTTPPPTRRRRSVTG
jgi:hypothetical protein